MKNRNPDGRVVETSVQPKNCYITLRVTDQEMSAIRALMQKHGYRSRSLYLRDVIFKRRVVSRKEVVNITDKFLSDKFNELIYQVNKIGVNYNQIASTFMRQVKDFESAGTPPAAIRVTEQKMEKLMVATESLRNEFALLIDIFERYRQAEAMKNL